MGGLFALAGLFAAAAYYGPRLAKLPIVITLRAHMKVHGMQWFIGLCFAIAFVPILLQYPAFLAILAARPARPRFRIPAKRTP
jgi:hypothetical protein